MEKPKPTDYVLGQLDERERIREYLGEKADVMYAKASATSGDGSPREAEFYEMIGNVYIECINDIMLVPFVENVPTE